jgi:hypothetical protein
MYLTSIRNTEWYGDCELFGWKWLWPNEGTLVALPDGTVEIHENFIRGEIQTEHLINVTPQLYHWTLNHYFR